MLYFLLVALSYLVVSSRTYISSPITGNITFLRPSLGRKNWTEVSNFHLPYAAPKLNLFPVLHLSLYNASQGSGNDSYVAFLEIWNSRGIQAYRCIISILVVTISFFGNLLVILTIACARRMRSVTNVLLLNMAIADMMVTLICMPIHFVVWFEPSVMLNVALCKVTPFFQGMSVSCSVYTLMVIAADRYRSILKPLKPRLRYRQSGFLIVVIWLSSMATVSPSLFIYDVGLYQGVRRCDELGWSKRNSIIFTFILMFLTYIIPLLFMVAVYGRIFFCLWFRKIPGLDALPEALQESMMKKAISRTKLVRLLLLVVATFLVCHLPMNIINFFWYADHWTGWNPPNYMTIIAFHAELLLYMNSALNPILYSFFHEAFKDTAADMLRWMACRGDRPTWSGITASMRASNQIRTRTRSSAESINLLRSKSAHYASSRRTLSASEPHHNDGQSTLNGLHSAKASTHSHASASV